MNEVMWINPEPGYGTPKELRDMEDNSAKIFPRWYSWEKENNVGFVLFDETESKWWADPASVHILSRAQGYKITYNFFSFIVKRENRIFSYGFVAKNYAQEAQLRNFADFGREMGSEEPSLSLPPHSIPKIQHKGTSSASSTITKTIIPPLPSSTSTPPQGKDVTIDTLFIDDMELTEIDDDDGNNDNTDRDAESPEIKSEN